MTTLSHTPTIDQAQLSARALERLFERLAKMNQGDCTPPDCRCSDCSRLSRGVGGYFQKAIKYAYRERRKRFIKKYGITGQDLLVEVVPTAILRHIESHERLQAWDSTNRELWLGCGDGERAVLVSSKRQLKKSSRRYRSKLPPDLVETFLNGPDNVNGEKLLNRIQGLLREYSHYADSRLYLFISIWLTGTYLYSLFDHYGCLFYHPRTTDWDWKTLTQTVTSHLTFEGAGPLNVPTPHIMLLLAKTAWQPEESKCWRFNKSDSFFSALERLGSGWQASTPMKRPDSVGGWEEDGGRETQEYLVFAPYVFTGIEKVDFRTTFRLALPFPLKPKYKPSSSGEKKYNSCECEEECKPVRDDLYIWALQNAEMVSLFYELNPFEEELAKLDLFGRAVDIWKPLFTVLFVLGFDPESIEWSNLSSLAVEMHQIPIHGRSTYPAGEKGKAGVNSIVSNSEAEVKE